MPSSENIEINPQNITAADIVIGIPSLNEGDNIAFVTEQIDKGLQRFFPQYKSVIINVDNFSSDDTRKVFLSSVTSAPKMYLSTPEGVKGKGNNFYNLFHKAVELGALGVAVFDADLRSIRPFWVREMLNPILKKNFDFCTPRYARNEYDGSITNHICYPLIRGLLGIDLRQPIGGDFALSPRLVEHCLQQEWHTSTRQYGIDIFLTLNAILGDFAIAQVGLGTKIHKPSTPKLGPMFSQVVATLFLLLHAHREKWLQKQHPQDTIHFGKINLNAAQTLEVDYKKIKAKALSDFKKRQTVLSEILPKQNFAQIAAMYHDQKIRLSTQLWCESVFDALFAFGESKSHTEIVEALKPLYFGRFIYFFRETLEKSTGECEHEIQNQARYFWQHRSYFLQKYICTKTARESVAA